MKRIFSLLLGIIIGPIFPTSAAALGTPTTLDAVKAALGVDVLYSGDITNLNITSLASGVYMLEAKSFPCNPGVTGCEPDRYEIRFPKIIDHIFGLGMQPAVGQVEVNDFLDPAFSVGHVFANRSDGAVLDDYAGGAYRMRTPVFAIPTENMILAYIQPEIKRLRLERNSTFCPGNQTCLVLKKHESYAEGHPAPLLLVKQSSLTQTYTAYYQALKQLGFFFKKPHYQVFGPEWQTFYEYGSKATKDLIINEALRYWQSKNVKLSMITVGSGYWQTPWAAGMSDTTDSRYPVMDSFAVSSNFGGLSGITQYYNILKDQGIYPLIGMRHRIQSGTVELADPPLPPSTNTTYCLTGSDPVTQPCDNLRRIGDLFAGQDFTAPSSAYPFKNFLFSLDPGDIATRILNIPERYIPYHFFLNTYDPTAVETWISLLRLHYGHFKGIKMDDMNIMDTRSLKPDVNRNFPDDIFLGVFPQYAALDNQDFITISRNDWFGVGSDALEHDWLGQSRSNMRGYPAGYQGLTQKFWFDTTLTQIMSGYPHAKNYIHPHGPGSVKEDMAPIDPVTGKNDYLNYELKHITDETLKATFVRETQLDTFFAVQSFSRLPDHLRLANGQVDTVKENIIIWNAKFRNRLKQYAYDQAQTWYETGVPTLNQPLMFRFGDDPEIYQQYTYLNASDDRDYPKNEFMFGNALLVRPVFNLAVNQRTYFPQGTWKPLIGQTGVTTGNVYTHGYNTYPMPDVAHATGGHNLDYPVFLKAGEILVLGKEADPQDLTFYVFFNKDSDTSSVYTLHLPGKSNHQLQASRIGEVVTLTNLSNQRSVAATPDTFGKGFYTGSLMALISDEPLSSPTSSQSPWDTDQDGDLDFLDFITNLSFGDILDIFNYTNFISWYGR